MPLGIMTVHDTVIRLGGGGAESFDFKLDSVLDGAATQADVFGESRQLVHSAMDGYHVGLFAYGQTGPPLPLRLPLARVSLCKPVYACVSVGGRLG